MIHPFPIRHVTQQGNQYAGDCGAACVMMLTGERSFARAYSAMNLQPGKWAHIFNNLRRGLTHYGIRSEYERLAAFEIRDQVEQGRPVICLIKYANLTNDLKRADYNGAHYVLAVGHGPDHILIHDPLGTNESGAFVMYPDVALHRAMRDTGNAYDYQCLVVDVRWQKPETTDEGELSAELKLQVLYKKLGATDLGSALMRIDELKTAARGNYHKLSNS